MSASRGATVRRVSLSGETPRGAAAWVGQASVACAEVSGLMTDVHVKAILWIKNSHVTSYTVGSGLLASVCLAHCGWKRRLPRRMTDRWGQMFDSWGHPGA